MKPLTENEFRTLLRRDLWLFIWRSFRELNPSSKFQDNWHIAEIARALEDCVTGKCKRLIINMPPRSLKSHMASIAFPAWLLGLQPSAQIICASYGQDLADKLARDTRTLMTSQFYRNTFAARLVSDRAALDQLLTTENGIRRATSVGGALTGLGGDFLIIDDPSKPEEALSDARRKTVNEWYDHTLLSRLNNKQTGCVIVIMQRMHEDDLVGHVLQSENWRHLCYPAIATRDELHTFRGFDGKEMTKLRREGEALHPEREPVETLAQIQKTIGTYNFAGQYQQAPAPAGGAIVKLEWFKAYATAGLPEKFELVVQSWDTANKVSELNDYSVCTTWGIHKKNLYLLHVLRKRLEYPDLKRLVVSHAHEFSATNVLIEDKASGTQLIQDLKRDGFSKVIKYSSSLDKVLRMQTVTPTIENGFVHLPDQAAWLEDYRHELAMFPAGAHDDQVDSTSQALDWYRNKPQYVYGLLEVLKKQQLEAPNQAYAAMYMRPRGAPRGPYGY